MHPTPLPPRLPIHMAQRLPEPQRPIPNGQGGGLGESAAFEVQQELFPRLLALAVAVPESDKLFVACRISPNNDEDAMPRCLKPGLEVHPIDPAIHVLCTRQVSLLPLPQFFLPPLLQPTERGGGQPRRLGSQERL